MSNLLQFLDSATKCLDDHGNMDVIFLDFAKAFDKVPHQRLLCKIEAHGISEISETETITETEIIDPTLTETEMMVILKTEIL